MSIFVGPHACLIQLLHGDGHPLQDLEVMVDGAAASLNHVAEALNQASQQMRRDAAEVPVLGLAELRELLDLQSQLVEGAFRLLGHPSWYGLFPHLCIELGSVSVNKAECDSWEPCQLLLSLRHQFIEMRSQNTLDAICLLAVQLHSENLVNLLQLRLHQHPVEASLVDQSGGQLLVFFNVFGQLICLLIILEPQWALLLWFVINKLEEALLVDGVAEMVQEAFGEVSAEVVGAPGVLALELHGEAVAYWRCISWICWVETFLFFGCLLVYMLTRCQHGPNQLFLSLLSKELLIGLPVLFRMLCHLEDGPHLLSLLVCLRRLL